MRRVKFYSWIRRKAVALAGAPSFNLRKLAAQAQREDNPQLRAALMLYAHENDCYDRLLRYVYVDAVREEFQKVEKGLGARQVERLALRGTPMMLLPLTYRELLEEFAEAHHAPERNADEKRDLLERSRQALLESGTSPSEVARALGLNVSNTYAYLSSGDVARFTVETAREIAAYLETQASK